MVDFLSNISNHFRERFLKTHYQYLYHIAYLIRKTYNEKDVSPAEAMVIQLLEQKPKIKEKKNDPPNETPEFRNLRNCWYNECTLNYPLDNLDGRIKFASWKIMQCYYTVFSAIASLVCCHHKEQFRIKSTLNLYSNDFLCGRLRAFTFPPLNLCLNQQGIIPKNVIESITWKWGKANSVPVIERCLSNIQEKNKFTAIPHYLRTLREVFTYQDMYLLFRLYGESPKEKLDESLRTIAFAYSLQAEFYLINLFGWNAVKRQYKVFISELRDNLEIDSPVLVSRFKTYAQYFNERPI